MLPLAPIRTTTFKKTMDAGSILNGTTYVTPIGSSPLGYDVGNNVLSGWPLFEIFPNINYNSRYRLDVTTFLADLGVGEVTIDIPAGLGGFLYGQRANYMTAWYRFQIGNLRIEWNRFVPQARITIEDQLAEAKVSGVAAITQDSYELVDFGVALTDPTSVGISNHYMVKYAAMDRGYGRAKHGYFYAASAGTWQFSIDALDVAEMAINDGVVASKYSDSGLSGDYVLNGSIDLTVGFHHMVAYTSDRSNSAYPKVWFKKPGDVDWTTMATDSSDGLTWNNTYVNPVRLRFSLAAGDITVSVEYDDTNKVQLTFDSSLLTSGNFSVMCDTLPRYMNYHRVPYTRESNFVANEQAGSLPPSMWNGRFFMYYSPLVEALTLTEHTDLGGYLPKYAVSLNGTTWYSWTGSAFAVATVTTVANLATNGNTMYELNSISRSNWETFMGSAKNVLLMFTGPAPLALCSNTRMYSDATVANYILCSRHHIPGTMRTDLRTI